MMANILVVDDSALSRKMSRRILEGVGHTVSEAADGLSALEQYALAKPDLVLLDVTMPEMDGFEVLRQLRLLEPTARIIMVTADIQNSTRDIAVAAGAAGFVAKPMTGENVLRAVDAAMETARS